MARMSLRARLGILFAVVGLLVGLMTAAGAVALNRLANDRGAVVDRIDPAREHLDALLTAYVNQETGVRGYALTGQSQFLEPYDQGVTEEAAEQAALHQSIGGDAQLMHALDAVTRAGGNWHTQYADPAVQATRAGQNTYASDFELAQSKALFDQVRATVATASQDLQIERQRATDRLTRTADELAALLIASVIVLVLTGILLWRALRRWVTEPLAAVGADTQAVTAGDLDHGVDSAGPPEIARLANDIEAMRRRIISELAAVRDAQAALETSNEDLARSNEELEQFAYVASHDLQEPLRKVASFCQLIEQRYSGQLDERGQQYIDFAVDGAKRMQDLINDLLAFSRVGRTTEGFEPVDLRQCVETATHKLASMVAETAASVEIDGDLAIVDGDRGLLTAVFQNLIGNAIKFRSDKPPRIVVAATQTDGEATMCVEDNGIGIEQRFADRIFVIFQRLHGREAYAGTGIGLALSRKIVEFHGGRIWLDTERVEGARFCFTLPVTAKETRDEPDEQRQSDRDPARRG